MWTNGTTSRGTATILELPAALTLIERWSLPVLLKWMDSSRSATGTRYSFRAYALMYTLPQKIFLIFPSNLGSTEYVSAVPNTPVFAPSSIPTQNI